MLKKITKKIFFLKEPKKTPKTHGFLKKTNKKLYEQWCDDRVIKQAEHGMLTNQFKVIIHHDDIVQLQKSLTTFV